MANRTASYAVSIHGTNPQYLIEKIIRSRIYDSKYWKEHCTLLTSALVLEKAVDDLRYVGGTYGGNVKPTPFLCLLLKLLQIQPQKEIIYLYINQPDFKYLRALGAFYLRLVGQAGEIYCKLEPLLKDYRKLRFMDKSQKFDLIHIDELVDNLLREERVCDIALPRITKRSVMETNGDLGPYDSWLDDDPDLTIAIKQAEITFKETAKEEAQTSKDGLKFADLNKYRHHQTASKPPRPSGDFAFTQEEVDKENSVRAMVGLGPLK